MSATDDRNIMVTFAGSADAFGSGDRLQACIAVQGGDQPPISLDCGARSLVALKRQGIDPSQVAAVVVSHLHVDHYGGLPLLILDGQFHRRVDPLVGCTTVPGTTWHGCRSICSAPPSATTRRVG
jgi:ribonuclease BN (tRNA processing enzyme)